MKQIKAFLQSWMQSRRSAKVTLSGARKRVQRGAEYLDDIDPAWYRRVNADTLELANGGSCILGQLHGDFRLGLTRAKLYDLSSAPRGNLSPVNFGFHCHYYVGEELQRKDYQYLNQAWGEAVRARLDLDDNSGDSFAGSVVLDVSPTDPAPARPS